jgi:hypothetical protein
MAPSGWHVTEHPADDFILPVRELTVQDRLHVFPMSSNLGRHPLFLEDENIFPKSASVVQILEQFPIVPRRPIFDSPQNKKKYFP